MNAFLTALGFLTRIPLPGKGAYGKFSQSIIFFPLVGAIIGGLNVGLYLLLKPFLPTTVLIVFVIAFPLFVTGAIHFDGLMDTCDGIFSGASRERILEIMKDSRVGAMGVIGGIFDVMLRYSILLELPEMYWPALLIAQTTGGRWVMSMALHFFPYAGKQGLGESFMKEKKLIYAALSTFLALLIIFVISGWHSVVIMIIAGLFCLLAAIKVTAKIGGLTGDVYGALNEAAENIFLLLCLVGCLSLNLPLSI